MRCCRSNGDLSPGHAGSLTIVCVLNIADSSIKGSGGQPLWVVLHLYKYAVLIRVIFKKHYSPLTKFLLKYF